jgi:hypothetical protein
MTSLTLWLLVTLQILMGAFDTLYHHELTERLAWRPSQRRELRLHGIRNFLYAALFLVFAWREPRGAWAALAIAVLVAEVAVTLIDFVEEDVSRKLPASERINHTLLALNYGAILVLLVPILVGWASDATALTRASYGAWGLLLTAAAAGQGRRSRRGAAGAADGSGHRRDRADRTPPGRGARRRGPSRDRAGARPEQGCAPAAAVLVGDPSRSGPR